MPLNFEPKELKNNVNVSKTSYVHNLILLSLGVILITIVVYFTLGVSVDLLVKYLPLTIEQKIGTLISKAKLPLNSQKHHKEKLKLQSMLNNIQKKCTNLPYNFNIYITDEKKENAWALPGGTILFTSSIFKNSQTENEIMFILAHELGHFKNRDHLRRLGRSLVVMSLLAVTVGYNNSFQNIIDQVFTLADLKYSRKQEESADLYGLQALNCYYGHIGGVLNFFERDKNKFNNIAEFYLSHPTSKKRISKLKDEIHRLRYKQGQTVNNSFKKKRISLKN